MSVKHLLMKLVFGLAILLEAQLDYRLRVDEVPLVLGLRVESYMSQSTDSHNPYIHSFSIIGGP